MRSLIVSEDRAVDWHEVDDARIEGPGEAIVRPLAVALCDLDRPIIVGEAPVPPPVAIGHECVAEVVEVGEEVSSFSAGDLVVVPFQISCGACDRCRAGLTGDCREVPPGSMYGFGAFGGDWGGLVSDLARVPFAEAMLVPVPDGVAPATLASASDNLPDAWRTVSGPLAENPGADVLVIGGGAPSIGLYAVDFARALGAGEVAYVDTNPDRLALAAELGAEAIEGLDRKYKRRQITVNATASHEGLHAALRSTARGGVCTSVGIYYEEMTPMPVLEMYTAGVRFVTGRVAARPVIPPILDLVASGDVRPDKVTSNVAAWDEAPEAVLDEETKLVIERPAGGRR